MFLESNTLSVSKCQQTVVVHDGVHVLNPQCIDVTVEHDVLPLIFVGRFVYVAENIRQQSIGPVARVRIEDAVKLDDTAVLGIYRKQLGHKAESVRE